MRLEAMDYLRCPACNKGLRLKIEIQTEYEVINGVLDCPACEKHFEIREGLPNLIFPEELGRSDFQNQLYHDRHPEYDARKGLFRLGIWEFALGETRARNQLIDKLKLEKNASVLETGVGNGPNLPIIAEQIGNDGQIDGIDISFKTLKVARSRMKARNIQVELVQGNASFLPYKSDKFDAVLHVGALNKFKHKKRAIQEMFRVAKKGAKIVICDEGLAPGKENTLLGKWILRRDRTTFSNEPPVEFVPKSVKDLKVYWIWQRSFWVVEFRKVQ